MFRDVDVCDAAQEYFKVWNSHDLKALSAILAAEVVLQDWNVHVSGVRDVLKANGEIFESFSNVKISIVDLYPCVPKLTCACEIRVNLNDIAKTELKVLDVIRFDTELKVISVCAYKL